jgi:hypothetical protein
MTMRCRDDDCSQILSPKLWDSVPDQPRSAKPKPLSDTVSAALELLTAIACALGAIALVFALGVAVR